MGSRGTRGRCGRGEGDGRGCSGKRGDPGTVRAGIGGRAGMQWQARGWERLGSGGGGAGLAWDRADWPGTARTGLGPRGLAWDQLGDGLESEGLDRR